MVGIIKYGSGNIFSVISAVKYIGKKTILIDKPETIDKVNFIILPGVGNFGAGIEFLRKMELYEAIIDKVNNGIPFLGICLGFQFLFEWSEEGNRKGFAIFKGEVLRFKNKKLKVPHMGWNRVEFIKESNLFNDIMNNSYFYFAHSYYAKTPQRDIIFGKTNYGINFPSIIINKNIVGVQFHPEKSGKDGLVFIKNFLEGKWLQ